MLTTLNLKTLAIAPVVLIGASSMMMGLAWIFAPEPWLLDKSANEFLLQTSYDALFASPGVAQLSDYLKGVYGFFGMWIFAFGLMVVAYVKATGFSTKSHRNCLHGALLIILGATYALQFKYIPSSHFLWVSHSFLVAILISLYASSKLE